MNITLSIEMMRKWASRVACLGMTLIIQPVSADVVSLGGAYSRFDDLLIVAMGSNTAHNCANLRTAIAAVAGGSTVKLPPETYDCGNTELIVPSGVTLEGSGQQNTRIIGQSIIGPSASVDLKDGAELYNLAVENTSAGAPGVAEVVLARRGSVLNHVTLISEGAGNTENRGVQLLSSSGSGETRLNQVTIRVSGASSFNNGVVLNHTHIHPATLSGVNILATNTGAYGILGAKGTGNFTIRDSVISGDTFGIAGLSPGTVTVKMSNSQLTGGVSGTGTFTCFSVSNENLAGLDEFCAP